MADLGNKGQLCDAANEIVVCWSNLTYGAQPNGNGPISNVAPFVASAEASIVLLGRRGARMNAAPANGSGIWSFYELSPGTYYATEAGAARQWRIDVAADLSFTVTQVTDGFPFNASSGYLA